MVARVNGICITEDDMSSLRADAADYMDGDVSGTLFL
jgi:hypothetical protein